MRVTSEGLRRLAGGVWVAVGLGLSIVGLRFVFGWGGEAARGSTLGITLALGLGGLIGALKGKYVLSRTARRNRRRIERLAEPRLWQVFTGRFYVLILGMMLLGRGLRALAAAGWLGGYVGVGGIYVGIGLALLVSSSIYFLRPPVPLDTRLERSPAARQRRRGVLLVNLGSPSAPTRAAVRRFLREFLGDPRVVEVNRLLWAFVLNVMVLPLRSGRSAALYRSIWGPQGSPLIVHSRRLRELLAARLGPEVPVALGMRYGEPALADAIGELLDAGCTSVHVLPLFPQYSNTTTGSVVERVARVCARLRHQPSLSFQEPFFEDPQYIEAVARRAEECGPASFTVFSFHGLPESYVERGDPYLEQCGRTAWLLAQRLGLERGQWELAFQSRFGDEPWLQPFVDELVPALAAEHPRVRVLAPGFSADCLETLEELGIQLKELFREAGGEELVLVPALNDHPAWVEALASMLPAGEAGLLHESAPTRLASTA